MCALGFLHRGLRSLPIPAVTSVDLEPIGTPVWLWPHWCCYLQVVENMLPSLCTEHYTLSLSQLWPVLTLTHWYPCLTLTPLLPMFAGGGERQTFVWACAGSATLSSSLSCDLLDIDPLVPLFDLDPNIATVCRWWRTCAQVCEHSATLFPNPSFDLCWPWPIGTPVWSSPDWCHCLQDVYPERYTLSLSQLWPLLTMTLLVPLFDLDPTIPAVCRWWRTCAQACARNATLSPHPSCGSTARLCAATPQQSSCGCSWRTGHRSCSVAPPRNTSWTSPAWGLKRSGILCLSLCYLKKKWKKKRREKEQKTGMC